MAENSLGLIRATQETLEKLASRISPSVVLEEAKASARRSGVVDNELERAAHEILARLRSRTIKTIRSTDQLRSVLDKEWNRLKAPAGSERAGDGARSRVPLLFGQAPEKLLHFGQALERAIPFLRLREDGPVLRAENGGLFRNLQVMMSPDEKNFRVKMDLPPRADIAPITPGMTLRMSTLREFAGGHPGTLEAVRWIREQVARHQPQRVTGDSTPRGPSHPGSIDPVWIAVPRKVVEFSRSLGQRFNDPPFQARPDGSLQVSALNDLRLAMDNDGRNIRLTIGEASREFSAGPKGLALAVEWIRKHS